MGDVLKVLTEASYDSLFVVTGLALLVLAIIGSITGKVALGQQGRLVAAAAGVILIGAGLWMHTNHGLKIRSLVVTAAQNQYDGACPVAVNLQGIIYAEGSGTAVYEFEHSDGTRSPAAPLDFDKTTSKIVSDTWNIAGPLSNGTARLNILSPKKLRSPKPLRISVLCEATPPKPAAPPMVAPAGAPVLRLPARVGVAVRATAAAVPTVDSVQITDSSLPTGARVPRGRPIVFHLGIRYNLVSADTALLAISVAQLQRTAAACDGSGEFTDSAEVPIQRGLHDIRVDVTWSGDTGQGTKGRVAGAGYLSFAPSFWQNNNGRRGDLLRQFGTAGQYCYSFGP